MRMTKHVDILPLSAERSSGVNGEIITQSDAASSLNRASTKWYQNWNHHSVLVPYRHLNRSVVYHFSSHRFHCEKECGVFVYVSLPHSDLYTVNIYKQNFQGRGEIILLI